ncbi:MAG TPA: DUF2087 domain-containing protein [Streptosporangiaceae bacterium]|jgi:hypothetical protein
MAHSLEEHGELRPFLQDGRIITMPAKRARRLLLLDCIAQEFEPGRQYPEAEVDKILKAAHDDHAALRRYLVDEGFLSRKAGLYWRSGGTVDTPGLLT